jgi:hypothetical protein
MKYLIIAAVLAIALTGCGSMASVTGHITPSKCDATIVKVPVPINPPAPPVVQRPALAIYQLSAGDEKNPAKVAKAYKASVKSLQGYATQLEIILNGYRNASVQPTIPTVEEVARPVAASAVPASGGN